MGFIQDFKEFAFKGNLIDMAVGIIMGTAAAAIIQSFIKNIIAPFIAMVAKVPDLSSLTAELGTAEVVAADGTKTIEPILLQYGSFIQNVIDFAILALVIFIALKIAAKWMKKAEAEAPPKEEIVLLTEIRDQLAKK